jgi:hypothetical protein
VLLLHVCVCCFVQFLHRLLFQSSPSSSLHSLPDKQQVLAFASLPLTGAGASSSPASSGVSGSGSVMSHDSKSEVTDAASLARHFLVPVVGERERAQPHGLFGGVEMEKRMYQLVHQRYVSSLQAAHALRAATNATAAPAAAATASGFASDSSVAPASAPTASSTAASSGKPPALSARRQRVLRVLELLCSVLVGADTELSADFVAAPSASTSAAASLLNVPASPTSSSHSLRTAGSSSSSSGSSGAASDAAAQLWPVLRHMREQLEVRVEHEFEVSAHLLCVLQELEDALKLTLETVSSSSASSNPTPPSASTSSGRTPPAPAPASASASAPTAAASGSASASAPASAADSAPAVASPVFADSTTVSLSVATSAPAPTAAASASAAPAGAAPLTPRSALSANSSTAIASASASTSASASVARKQFLQSLYVHLTQALDAFSAELTQRAVARKQHTQAIQRQCEAELERGKRECAHYNTIIFAHKVAAFARSVEIS